LAAGPGGIERGAAASRWLASITLITASARYSRRPLPEMAGSMTLATAIPAIRAGRYLSLFYWSAGNDQISNGVTNAGFAVLIAVGLCALAAALVAFRRADLN
jgi:ABC-type transport system involved in multi-copper enzyme maturation permease subunit